MNHPADHFDRFAVDDEAKILQEFADAKFKFMLSAFFQNRIVGNLGFFGGGSEFLKHSARIGMGIEKGFQNVGLGFQMLAYAKETGSLVGVLSLVEAARRSFSRPARSSAPKQN